MQLTKGQVLCGAELACMLIDAYETDATSASEESLGRVLSIVQGFPLEGEEDGPPIEACTKVVSAALKWTSK